MSFNTLKTYKERVEAKKGDRVAAKTMHGDYEEGDVIKVNSKTITVKFKEVTKSLPLVWGKLGHLKGSGFRCVDYFLLIKGK